MIDKQPDARPAGNFLVGILLGGSIVASAGAAYYLYHQSNTKSSGLLPSVSGSKARESLSGTNSKNR